MVRGKHAKINCRGFPGGSVVKNLTASAGDMGSISDLGGSHMLQSNKAPVPHLLSLHALEPVYCNWRVAPLATTREKSMQQQSPSTAKNK